ncbi:MAG: hypothetical protein JWQ98_3368 [Chlorobi bacterium]|nr:hypothetical protein [Chlorobiota bacterium]
MTKLFSTIILLILTASFVSSCSGNPVDAEWQPDPYGYWAYRAAVVHYDAGSTFDFGNCDSQGHLLLNSDGTWSEKRNFDGVFFPIGGNFIYTESTGAIIFNYNDGTFFESGTLTTAADTEGAGDRIMYLMINSHPGYQTHYTLRKKKG